MRLRNILINALSAVSAFGASSSDEPAGLVRRDDVGDILTAFSQGGGCAGCQNVVSVLKSIVLRGGAPAFVSAITDLCKLVHAEDDDVCEGAVGLEGPIIARQLENMTIPSHTSDWFCVTFLGQCGYPDVVPYQVSIPKPKRKQRAKRPHCSGKDPIQIVHYSDIHIDPFYVTGSNYNCTKPICCRVYGSGDAPGNNSYPAGPFGNSHCDAPVSLEESMYEAIGQIAPNAKFGIFTGDIIDHAIWNTTQAQNTININDAYNHMNDALSLVYGTAGNHESHPTNAFQTVNQYPSDGKPWVYKVLSAAWSRWVGKAATAQAKKTGYYSAKYPGGKLRVISLNTNDYYIQNYWLYQTPLQTDPSGQFAWLVKELQAAEKAGERVYLIGHMPMGLPDAFHDTSNYFDQIVNRYSSTIAALFFGHTHRDEFEIAYSNYSARTAANALAVSYICPSMTPTSGSPTFRVYSVDPETFAVLDSTTYYADMSNPDYQTSGPVWTKYYSAKEVYGPLVSPQPGPNDELSPAFWHNVTVAFEQDQSALDGYLSRKNRGSRPVSCTGTCATQEICQIRAMRSQDNCFTPTPGVHFSKRELALEEDKKHQDECGLSVLRRAIGGVVDNEAALEHLKRAAERLKKS